MKKSESALKDRVLKEVRKIIKNNPYGYSDGVEIIARGIEKDSNFRIKDFDGVITYLMNRELELYKTEEDEEKREKGTQLLDTSKKVIERAKEYRRIRNRKTSKVDTNILTHAPYFVGGSRKRKQKAKEDGYVIINKGGLRKMTYENDLGELLTMADAKTLFALFSIWEEQGFPSWLSFTEYGLLSKLNMRDGGKQYKNLRNSLEKLRNTSIVMKEAYNISSGKREVTNRFKLIIADKFITDYDHKGGLKYKKYEIQFSPYVDLSLKTGYYSLISLAVFNELEVDTAQGIYLLMTGIRDMDRNDIYMKKEGIMEITLQEVYDTLFLESASYRNRMLVEKGCEELKEIGIINDFYFKKKNKGRGYDTLFIIPSDWHVDVMKKKEDTVTLENNKEMRFLN